MDQELKRFEVALDDSKNQILDLRQEMESNPLTVLPSSMAGHHGPITAVDAEMIGNYAIRIRFSDGHDTGLYSWRYLREIDPANQGRKEDDPSGRNS